MIHFRSILRRRDERGAIAIIAALAMPMVLAATALSFDIGRVVDTNRSTQALADAVALDAANFLIGTPAGAPDPIIALQGGPFSSGQAYTVDQVVQYEGTESALRNGLNLSSPTWANDVLSIGVCTAAGDVACQTFTPVETCPLSTALPASGSSGGCTLVSGANPATVVNAVKMGAANVTNFVFEVGSATSNRSATAMRCSLACVPPPPPTTTTTTVCPPGTCGTTTTTTVCPPTVCPPTTITGTSAFSIGSGLVEENTSNANFNTGVTFLDQILDQELHANPVDISALSYNGLSTASVSLGDILAANSSIGTLSNLVDSTITPGQALSYFYNALMLQNSSASIAAANQLSTELGVGPSGATGITAAGGLQLCQLVTVALPGPSSTSACNVSGSQLAPVAYAQFNALDWLVGTASLINGQHALSLNVASNVPTGTGLGNLVANVTVNVISPVAVAGPGPSDKPCPTPTAGSPVCPVTATDTQAQVSISIPNLPAGISISLQAVGAQATGTLDGVTCTDNPNTYGALVDGTTNAATVTPTFSLLGTPYSGTQVSVASGTFSDQFTGPFGLSSPAPQTSGNSNPNIVIGLPSQLTSIPAVGLVLTSLNSDLSKIDGELAPMLSDLGLNIGYATVADNYVNCATSILVQ